MKKTFRSKKSLFFLIVILILGATYFFTADDSGVVEDIEIQAVTRNDVKEIVSETGFVQPSREVTLAFERGGRVVSIPVQEGDTVEEGDILIQLDTSERKTELASANARLRAEQVRLNELMSGADTVSLGVTESAVASAETTLQNAKANLEKVIIQQDQLVANAEKTLRISGLQAYLTSEERENSTDSYTAPTVSGTYNSEEEGLYRIELYGSGGASGSSYRVTGLESGTESVSTVSPTPIGTRGLYLQFPTNFAKRTTWEISIPNTRSSTYLTNLNAYNSAVKNRDTAIKTAENTVKSAEAALLQAKQQLTQVSSSAREEKIEAQNAVVNQMLASVQTAEIALEKTTLKAPFAGIVTEISTEEGEIVSASMPVTSLISSNNFELTVNISESDIQEISLEDIATVIFDAYDDTTFTAQVVRIAPNANIVEGVRVFEVTMQFTEKDDRILSGLSADIDILAAERKNVIAVPTRAIAEREEGKFVRTWDGTTLKHLPVETGLRGSDGLTEIISGLSEGTEIITFAREDTITKLEQANQ